MPKAPKSKQSPKCGICKEKDSKYTCPADQVLYCSVACFKKHKANAPCTGSKPLPAPPKTSLSRTLTPPPVPAPSEQHLADPKPLKALKDLSWPPEPDMAVFMDPLRKNDPKPLRQFEWEAVATSLPLRQLLASSTSPLLQTLTRLSSLPTPLSREAALRHLLQLPSREAHQPAFQPDRPMRDYEEGKVKKEEWCVEKERRAVEALGEVVRGVLKDVRG